MSVQQPHKRTTTYARRRNRGRDLQQAASSPLEDIDREDITLSEMSRRMKKRARQTTVGRLTRADSDDVKRSSKRLKPTPDVSPGLDSVALPTLTSDEYLASLNDGTKRLAYQTPFNLSPKEASALNSAFPDRMSPVPAGRRSLSRTTSRNLKENSNILHGLASPFHSRSGSKAGSPKKKKAKKPAFYMKARTRSDAEAPTERIVPDDQPIPSVSMSVARPRSSQREIRGVSASSTAYMLQQVTDEDWFRPAKALSRSPFSEDYVPPDTPLPDWSFTTNSFFTGVPRETSTPQTKIAPARTSDEGTPSAPNTPECNTGDVVMADPSSRPRVSSRRRTMHLSKDSIFSSSLEVTTTSTGSFLLSKSESRPHISALHCAPCSPAVEATLEDVLVPEAIWTPCSSPSAEELSGMLGTLGINEGKDDNAPGCTTLNRSRSLDGGSLNVPIVDTTTLKEHGHGRNRAGTIRASDFMRPAAVNGAPGTNLAPAAPVTVAGPLTTRTRSGTIRPARPPILTRVNSEPSAAAVTPEPKRPAINASASTVNGAGAPVDAIDFLHSPFTMDDPQPDGMGMLSRAARLPRAVRRRILAVEEMPLEIMSDESDDELLLEKGKDWNWDGRWD